MTTHDPHDPARLEATVALFTAFAHPARLGVLLELDRHGPSTVGSLQACLGVEQSALSHQLRVLRDHHLVSATREGRHVVYALADEHVATILRDAWDHGAEPR